MMKDYTIELMGQCLSRGIAVYSVSIHSGYKMCALLTVCYYYDYYYFHNCYHSHYECYWYYYISFFFNAVIIDKWSGNLKEYPSLKGKYSLFLSYPYDKF